MSAKSKLLKLAAPNIITSREELTAVAIATADAALQRDQLILNRDAKLKEIEEAYNIEIELLNENVAKNEVRLRSWAVANRKEYFGDSKEFVAAGHVLSFRQSPGKVETIKGLTQNDAITALLGEEDEIQEKFLAVKATLDKAAILKAFDEKKGNFADREILERHGITIVSPELFSFKPNQAKVTAH